ncbi:MAG: hypothetical protein ACRDPE_09310 [Solirubrobacterales bacterium]
MKPEQYRTTIEETASKMSDQAILFQLRRVVGGMDKAVIEAEAAKRGLI